MKLIITSALAVTLATAAFAGNSDRYNDLRFDSAVGHLNQFTETPKAQTQFNFDAPSKTHATKPRFSTRNNNRSRARGVYAYSNPYGVGPNNDSR